MTALQVLRVALFILAAVIAGYGFWDRRPTLCLYWAGVSVYWLLNYVVS